MKICNKVFLYVLPIMFMWQCGIISMSNPFKQKDPISYSLDDVYPLAIVPKGFGDKEFYRNIDFVAPDKDGNYEIYPGFSEMTMRSYCFSSGSARPGKGNGYGVSPMTGEYAELFSQLLNNAGTTADIWQQDVQGLIWAILAKSNLNDLHPNYKNLAFKLLDKKQINVIQKNALKKYKGKALDQILQKMPESARKAFEFQNSLREKFSDLNAKYDDIEAIAAPEAIADPKEVNFKIGQWFQHPDGYLIRYIPDGYQRLTVQIYVDPKAENSCTNFGINNNKRVNKSGCGKRNFNASKNMAKPANGISQPVMGQPGSAENPTGAPPDKKAKLPKGCVAGSPDILIEELLSDQQLLQSVQTDTSKFCKGRLFETRITDLAVNKKDELYNKLAAASGYKAAELKKYRVAQQVQIFTYNCGFTIADVFLWKDSMVNITVDGEQKTERQVFAVILECKLSNNAPLTTWQDLFIANLGGHRYFGIKATNGNYNVVDKEFSGVEVLKYLKVTGNGSVTGSYTVTKLAP